MLHDDQSLGREATKRLLGQLKNFGTTLDNYLHLLLPQIVAIIGDTSNEMDIRRRAVRTIRDISEVSRPFFLEKLTGVKLTVDCML